MNIRVQLAYKLVKRYASGKVSLIELRLELDLQIQRFLEHFPRIPFLNGTQHLHLLPGVQGVVLDLMTRYRIPAVRIPHRILIDRLLSRRLPFFLVCLGPAFCTFTSSFP